MNNNYYPPKFKKNKRTGYYIETKPSQKLVHVKPTNNLPPKSSTVTNSIKKAINSAIEYVKSFKHKSNKDKNNEKLEEFKLEVLENEMINMVENVDNLESSSTEDTKHFNKFEDIIKILTIELHNAIGYTEQINAIEQTKVMEQTNTNEKINTNEIINQVNQAEKNLNELNNILKFLADNILDGNKKKKELLFTELTASNNNKSTYTIRVISLGIAITYATLEEFIEKIANRAGTVKSLCWFAGCPEQFNIELKKFIKLNNMVKKDYDNIFKIFKSMIDAYLRKNDPEIHSKIEHLINSTTGGRKRRPRNKSITVKKPRKARNLKKLLK